MVGKLGSVLKVKSNQFCQEYDHVMIFTSQYQKRQRMGQSVRKKTTKATTKTMVRKIKWAMRKTRMQQTRRRMKIV